MEFSKLEKQILWHLVHKNIRIGELGKIGSEVTINNGYKCRESTLSLHCIIRKKDWKKPRHHLLWCVDLKPSFSILYFRKELVLKIYLLLREDFSRWLISDVFKIFHFLIFQFRFWRSKIRNSHFFYANNKFAFLFSENFQRKMTHTWKNEEKSYMKRRIA